MQKVISFTLLLLCLSACTTFLVETSQPSMPNPASVFCKDNGNDLEIRTSADGSQTGVCVFSDGSECDEWAYFKGECGAVSQQTTPPVVTVEATEVAGDDSSVENDSGVVVTYIGNSGFLITTSHKKILIDAVFRGIDPVYTLPEDIQNALALAQPPFDNVDLILVSHSHRDHFDSSLVKQYLQNDPNTSFASQSRIASQFSTLANQIITLDPKPGEPVLSDVDGIQVEALALSHGTGDPGNIGFVIAVDNVKMFFSGDFDYSQIGFEEFRAYNLPEQKIDIAFVTHYYLSTLTEDQRFLSEGIGAKYLIPIHYYFTDPPFDRTTILRNYPEAILFYKSLTSWKMPE